MEKEKFVIKMSLSVRADFNMNVERYEIPSDKIYTYRQIDAVSYLSSLYHQYVRPILIRKIENGVEIRSSYGNAVLEFGKQTSYDTPAIGLSYATGWLSLYLRKC